ncbi:MAG: hypothetical protein ACI4HI_04785 [Lachnospiraceae bacterium]
MRERKKRGLLLGLTAIALLCGCGGARAEKEPAAMQETEMMEAKEKSPQDEISEREEAKDTLSDLYVLTKVDTKNRVLEAKRASDGKWRTCSYTGATYFYDKFGQSVTVADAYCGKVVTLKENSGTGNLEEVHFTDAVWEYSDVKDVKIDTESRIVTINGENYFYGSHYWVYSNDAEVNISDITEQDTLTVTGVDKKILSICITTGHGTVKLKNTKLFEGGWIKLGDVVCKIKKNMTFTAPEGTFELSVANDGYGDTKTVTVERNKTLEIDLDEYKGSGPKQCTITFRCDVQGAVLRINGDQIDYSQPVQLKYGTYAISLSADGYDTISEYLIVNSPAAEITLTMTSNEGKDSSTEADGKTAASDTNNTNNMQTSQPQQVVTPGELAGGLAGTKTGGDVGENTQSSQSGVTDPFADTGKTAEDTLNSTNNAEGKTDTQDSLTQQAVSTLLDELTN